MGCMCAPPSPGDCASATVSSGHPHVRRPYNRAMSSKPLYKITFLNHGKVYELYARHVGKIGRASCRERV